MRVLITLSVAMAMVLATAAPITAQDRLLDRGTANAGVVADIINFSGNGLFDASTGSDDSIRVRRAAQIALPLNTTIHFGNRVTVDATLFYSSGVVEYADLADGLNRTRRAHLQGVSDARVRATWRLAGDNLLVTLGANAPAGPTLLSGEEQRALRVLAAPALAMHAPAVGAGPSGTAGIVAARTFGATAAAVGLSFELRGQFQPINFAAAGLTDLDYRPGNATRLSAGLERLVGQGQLTLAVSAEVYSQDELLDPSGGAALGTAQLGPVIGADLAWQLPVAGLREFTVFASERYRAPLDRNGVSLEGSAAHYLSSGVRARYATSDVGEIFGTLEARHHTGLGFAPGVATARSTSGSVTLGVSRNIREYAIQPFVKAQIGRLTTMGPARTMTGFGGGIVLVRRF